MQNLPLTTLLSFILCGMAFASPPPYEAWIVWAAMKNPCADDMKDLCQKCTKFTKAPSVYEMCCEDREEVRTWCTKAMNYGLRQ